MAFDPCREWLGIDAVDLSDPYRVLGLEPDAQDAAAIGLAADARLEALRRVLPGPFAKAHAALIAKVEEARDSLLAQAFSTAPIERPDARAPWPVEPTARVPWSVEPAAMKAGSVRWPTPPAPLELESETESPPDEILAAPKLSRPARRPRRASTGAGGLLLASLALLAAAAAMITVLMLRNEPAVQEVALTPGQPPAVKAGPAAPPRPQPPVAPAPASEPATTVVEPATTDPPSAAEPPPDDGPERQLQPSMAETQSRRDADLAARQAADRAAEETRRQEMEAAEAKQRAEQEQLRREESIEALLRDAYAALQCGEFDTADRAIAAAEKRVGDDVEAATRMERWRLLATYAREFVGYRDQAFAAANEGREYTAEGKTFAVIEIGPDMFVYRVSGRTERVPRERIAPPIEMAIVEAWFAADGRAANHLFLGAHWLCLDPPNLARAGAAWRIAGDGGEEVEPLLALLEDPVIRRPGR